MPLLGTNIIDLVHIIRDTTTIINSANHIAESLVRHLQNVMKMNMGRLCYKIKYGEVLPQTALQDTFARWTLQSKCQIGSIHICTVEQASANKYQIDNCAWNLICAAWMHGCMCKCVCVYAFCVCVCSGGADRQESNSREDLSDKGESLLSDFF